jgi:hypothetical protein
MGRFGSSLQPSVGLEVKVKSKGMSNFAIDDGTSGKVTSPVLVGIGGGEESHVVLW